MIDRLGFETFLTVSVRQSDRIGRACWWVARELLSVVREALAGSDHDVLGESYTIATRVWVLARERSSTPELVAQLGRFARGLGRLAGVRDELLPVLENEGN